MNIRKAEITDSDQIAQCLLLAMEDIVYKFIGTRNPEKARVFMRYFAGQTNNQYSYENCWLVTDNQKVIAAINMYKGSELFILRKPILDYLEENFNRSIMPEPETQDGEIYIDTLGVLAEYRRKGIATSLLNFVIEENVVKRRETLGLLVDEENIEARNLYLKLGFKRVGRKTLMGKTMEHLQIVAT